MNELFFDIVFAASCALFFMWMLSHYVRQALHMDLNQRGAAENGKVVAEAWLQWGDVKGETLYQQRFVSERHAQEALDRALEVLNLTLPRRAVEEDHDAGQYWKVGDFELMFVIREATATDSPRAVWRPRLPRQVPQAAIAG